MDFIFEFNAMIKNIPVIFYGPKICEDDRHSNTIKQNGWKRQLRTYKRIQIFQYPVDKQ
jgi:hypothetical protein